MKTKCEICEKWHRNESSLSLHLKRDHNISDDEIWTYFELDFNIPKCEICKEKDCIKIIPYLYWSKTCSHICGSKHSKAEKTIHFNLEKYGFPNPMHVKEQANKISLTKKSWSPEKNKEINSKREETCEKKYKSKYAISSKAVRNSSKKTLKERYDIKNPWQLQKIIDKNSERDRKKGYETILNCKFSKPLFSFNEYYGGWKKILYKFECLLCKQEFNHKACYIPKCPYCFPIGANHITWKSRFEDEIEEFLKSIYQGEIEKNTRKYILNPETRAALEYDFYIPEFKLAIEFNGDYSHSDKPRKYHFNKFNESLKKGIHLIQIWEHKWTDSRYRSIIENMIKSKMNLIPGIEFSENDIKKCEPIKLKPFFEKNHINGYKGGKIAYYIEKDDEIISAIILGKPGFGKQETEWEILRIVGNIGIQKLWTAFEKDYSPKSCCFYSANDYIFDNFLDWKFYKNKESSWYWNQKFGITTYKNLDKIEEFEKKLISGEFLEVFNSGYRIWLWNKID